MKKANGARILCLALLAVLALTGCAQETDERTLDDFQAAYEEAGYVVIGEKAPLVELVGAEDGLLFGIGATPVKIYEYASAQELEEQTKDYPLIAAWPRNGKFLLDTASEAATEIFESVPKKAA